MTVLAEQMIDFDLGLYSRKNMKGHLTASALVLDQDNNALLIRHIALDRWLQPGGHLDRDEDPETGARRELSEETGLESSSFDIHPLHRGPRLLPIDVDSHRIPANEAKGEGFHLHHDFQYVYLLKGHSRDLVGLTLQADEVSTLKWVTLAELGSGDYGNRLKRVAEKIARKLPLQSG